MAEHGKQSSNDDQHRKMSRREYLGTVGASALGTATSEDRGTQFRGRSMLEELRAERVGTNALGGGVTGGSTLSSLTGDGLTIDREGNLNVTMASNQEQDTLVEFHDVDDYGADPTGGSASDAALDEALSYADDGDWIVMTNGEYLLQNPHEINTSVTIYARGSTITGTYYDTSDFDKAVLWFKGTRYDGSDATAKKSDLGQNADKHSDRVYVSDTGPFDEGDDVVVANTDSNGNLRDAVSRAYEPTRTRVRSVDSTNGKLYLETPLKYDYEGGSSSADEVVKMDPVAGPRVIGGTWTGDGSGNGPGVVVSLQYTRDGLVNDVHVQTYQQNAVRTIDSWRTRLVDCSTGPPLSFDGSHGETFQVAGSSDVYIVRPNVQGCRRGIDIRSGCKTVYVVEPFITHVTLKGFSYHNSSGTSVRGSFQVYGGYVAASVDDLDVSPSAHHGNFLEPSTADGHVRVIGTTIVPRIDAFGGGGNDIHFENVTIEAADDHNSGDLLDLNDINDSTFRGIRVIGNGLKDDGIRIGGSGGGKNLVVEGTVVGSFNNAAVKVNDSASDVDLDLDIRHDGSTSQTHGVEIAKADDISLQGRIRGSFSNDVVLLHDPDTSDGTQPPGNVDLDLDIQDAGSTPLAIHIKHGENVRLRGRLRGSFGDDKVLIENGAENVDISMDVQGSGSDTSKHAFKLRSCENVNIHDCYVDTAGRAVLFTGDTLRNITVANNRFGGDATDGVISDYNPLSPSTFANVRIVDNDVTLGSNGTIDLYNDVSGLWIKNNLVDAFDLSSANDGSNADVYKRDNHVV